MKKLIDYKLEVWGNTVLFQVLKMDESQIYKKSGPGFLFKSSSGLWIKSCNAPELADGVVFLWGDENGYNDVVVVRKFENSIEAKEYVNKVNIVIDEWEVNGGFDECKPKPKPASISEMYDDDISFVYLIDSTAGEVREVKNNQARSYVLHANKLGLAFLDYEVAKRQLERMEAIAFINDIIKKDNDGWMLTHGEDTYYWISYRYRDQFYRCTDWRQYNNCSPIIKAKNEKIINFIIENHLDKLDLIFGVNDDN